MILYGPSPLPHPASWIFYLMGGRVGEWAGAARSRKRVHNHA